MQKNVYVFYLHFHLNHLYFDIILFTGMPESKTRLDGFDVKNAVEIVEQ